MMARPPCARSCTMTLGPTATSVSSSTRLLRFSLLGMGAGVLACSGETPGGRLVLPRWAPPAATAAAAPKGSQQPLCWQLLHRRLGRHFCLRAMTYHQADESHSSPYAVVGLGLPGWACNPVTPTAAHTGTAAFPPIECHMALRALRPTQEAGRRPPICKPNKHQSSELFAPRYVVPLPHPYRCTRIRPPSTRLALSALSYCVCKPASRGLAKPSVVPINMTDPLLEHPASHSTCRRPVTPPRPPLP